MDFKLSKEHEMARKMFREFAENELEPLAVEIDEEERFPWENVEKFARYGMMGINIPKKYEGADQRSQERSGQGIHDQEVRRRWRRQPDVLYRHRRNR